MGLGTRMVEGGPMSVKSFTGDVNVVVRLAPALHLSLTGHRTSVPKAMGPGVAVPKPDGDVHDG